MKVVVNMNSAAEMLRRRGLEPGGRVQKLFTNECARHMDPYVPMQTGILKNTRDIEDDGVTYRGPYAQFQYYGKVMVGVRSRSAWAKPGERKVVTDKDLTYHGAPMRGPLWDVRMWADRGRAILNAIAKAAGGKAE